MMCLTVTLFPHWLCRAVLLQVIVMILGVGLVLIYLAIFLVLFPEALSPPFAHAVACSCR